MFRTGVTPSHLQGNIPNNSMDFARDTVEAPMKLKEKSKEIFSVVAPGWERELSECFDTLEVDDSKEGYTDFLVDITQVMLKNPKLLLLHRGLVPEDPPFLTVATRELSEIASLIGLAAAQIDVKSHIEQANGKDVYASEILNREGIEVIASTRNGIVRLSGGGSGPMFLSGITSVLTNVVRGNVPGQFEKSRDAIKTMTGENRGNIFSIDTSKESIVVLVRKYKIPVEDMK